MTRKKSRGGFPFILTGYTMNFKCPTCDKVIPSTTTNNEGKKQINGKFFPFCCQRCKLVDMGAWFNAEYVIPVAESDFQE